MSEMTEKTNGTTALRDGIASLIGRLPLVEQALGRLLRRGSAVFMFHRILPNGERTYDSEMVTSTEAFGAFLDWLRGKYRVLPLDELVQSSGFPNTRRPQCAITFDDGWIDNYLHAFPLLRQRQLPATIFLPLQFIGTSKRFWQDRLWLSLRNLNPAERRKSIQGAARGLPWFPIGAEFVHNLAGLRRFLRTRSTEEADDFADRLVDSTGVSLPVAGRTFLNWDEIHEMQGNGISFGSHSVSHGLLTRMEQAKATAEIHKSREELANRLRENITGFAYPWGTASWVTHNAVKNAGYEFAVTTLPGLITRKADRWMLPRIFISNSVLRCGEQAFASGKALLWCAKSALLPAPRVTPKNGKNVKIAFVVDTISDWEGGTERQLHTLIRMLDRNVFQPELCFLQPNPELPKETLPCPTRTVGSAKPEQTSSVIFRLFRLTRLLRQTRPQIVQTYFNEGIFSGILAARLSGVPRVIGSARNAGHWKKRRHRIAFRTVAKLADHWQCNSRTLWEYVRKAERVPAQRIEILPNVIDLSKFAPATPEERLALRHQLGLDEVNPVFVVVAALTPVKDHATLLDAAKLIELERPTAHYLLVGDGPLRSDLEKQAAKLRLSHVIHFLGRQADVRPYLAAADFGVLTSRSEGSSNSVLEYMAMGLPSVVSDIPANRELVSGVLFAPGNVAELAEKLLELACNTELCRKLRSEYSRTAPEFGLEKFAMRTQAFYTRLVAEVY
jgi:L-malate glycosyltransferase